MSEFTAGLLYRAEHAESIEPALEALGFIDIVEELNESWGLAIIDFVIVSVLAVSAGPTIMPPERAEEVREQVLAVSHQAPLLMFFNAEDHAWGYRIFDKGEVVASFELDYEAVGQLTEAALRAAHPDRKRDATGALFTREEYEAARAQILAEGAWHERALAGMRNANPQAFARFGLAPEVVAELETLLQPEALADALPTHEPLLHDTVERVIELLGIEDMRYNM